jgi:regulatory protein
MRLSPLQGEINGCCATDQIGYPIMNPTRDKALYLLARRDHSRRELSQKLSQKGFVSSTIQPVLDELENENLLNEDRFIASFIRSRSAKGYGPLKICAELGKRGIDHNRIRASDEWQETLWQEMAISARIKRFGEAIPTAKDKRMQQARFLQQRGFTTDQIRWALK